MQCHLWQVQWCCIAAPLCPDAEDENHYIIIYGYSHIFCICIYPSTDAQDGNHYQIKDR